MNKFARSITKWTEACDKRLNRLTSCIHHTCDFKQKKHQHTVYRVDINLALKKGLKFYQTRAREAEVRHSGARSHRLRAAAEAAQRLRRDEKYWTLPKSCGSQSSEWKERKKSRAERCRCACHPLQTHILHTFSFILVSVTMNRCAWCT